jgi:2-C-methyl-D-erythritol 2,4-cyclodiphosphate synthase
MIRGLTPARQGGTASTSPRGTTPFLIGHGYDIHRLQRGGRLTLGGVVVAEDVSAIAHSDGDVILHAIVDAILGALGQGDIGEHFSEKDPRWKSSPSRVFVETVVDRARAAGYRVGNVDITLQLERPKIAAHKPAIVAGLRAMLDPISNVNVKAGTNEGCDAVGRAEAVAAHAVVLLIAQP